MFVGLKFMVSGNPVAAGASTEARGLWTLIDHYQDEDGYAELPEVLNSDIAAGHYNDELTELVDLGLLRVESVNGDHVTAISDEVSRRLAELRRLAVALIRATGAEQSHPELCNQIRAIAS